MTAKASIRYSSLIALFIPLLLACDGITGSDNLDNNDTTDESIEVADDSILAKIISELNEGAEQTRDNTANKEVTTDSSVESAISIANNEINVARSSCGLQSLSVDPALIEIAMQHADYIKYVFANATPTTFNPHVESEINDIANVTGNRNPFFTGDSFAQRLVNANYANAGNGTTENIAQSLYFNSIGNLITPEAAADSMTKSLLAAPYHLRALMLPSSVLIGTSIVAYKPYKKDNNQYQSYVLVTHAAATQDTRDQTFEGVFTYPCQGVSDTVTALYNEAPDPFRGARNLQTNPIGQPVYINVPTAKTIKLRNISFYDVARNSELPIQLLDTDQDPYKNTDYEIPANEAFILPLTDTLKSCKKGIKKAQNCGLYGNSQYRVSFDVMIDNKALISQSFTFTTGEVSY